jgi:hypothetical protein
VLCGTCQVAEGCCVAPARYLKDAVRQLPAGASCRDVSVKVPRQRDLIVYQQPFTAAGRRMCLLCLKVPPRTAHLHLRLLLLLPPAHGTPPLQCIHHHWPLHRPRA